MVRDYVRFLPNDAEFNGFLTEFQQESQRAAAVLGAAYLDDLLKQVLEALFIDESRTVKELLSDLNALGTFGARAKAVRALGLITSEELSDLSQISQIRNKFAHRKHKLTFEDEAIQSHCRNFQVVKERFQAEPGLARAYPNEPRALYNLEVALLAYYLTRRLAHVARLPAADPALWPRYDLPTDK